jgi:hypothetical protein
MNAVLDDAFLKLIDDLCALDDATNGHPQVAEMNRPEALAGLERIVLDLPALDEHTRRLQKRFGRTFRHQTVLSEERAERIVSEGAGVLSNDELAALLLNPVALRDLAFRINEALPDCWLERLSDVGRQVMQKEGIVRKPRKVIVPTVEEPKPALGNRSKCCSDFGDPSGKRRPMNEELARNCFRTALAYVSENCSEELEWVRGISPDLLDQMTCADFLSTYCWVVYASGFRVSVLTDKFPALKTAFCEFNIDDICQRESLEPALAVINNRRKAEGFVEGCRRIRSEGFEAFKARVKAEGMDALQGLPFIGSITKKHLARNIGLLDVPKDDIWMVRLANEFSAPDVQQLTAFLAEEFGEKQGTVDLVLWRFCADGVWEEWRSMQAEGAHQS